MHSVEYPGVLTARLWESWGREETEAQSQMSSVAAGEDGGW